MEEIAPEPATEPPPPTQGGKGNKKKPWVIVVAVIVAVALIASAAYVLFIPDDDDDNGDSATLTVTLSPDPIPNIAAGGVQALSVVVEYGDDVVTEDVTYSWSVDPSTLGDFDFTARANVQFEAEDAAGTGTVTCEVTYEGETATVNSSLVVEPPFLDTVSVNPSTKTLAIDDEWDFTAVVIDSVGAVVVDATIAWNVSGIDAGDYTLNSTTGAMITFSASVEAEVNLTATATKGTDSLSGSANIDVVYTPTVYDRTMDYLWYDMFEPELGPWYEDRWDYYGQEYALTDSYPYIYLWAGDAYSFEGDTWIYSMMRLNITGRNMTELNMDGNPEFIPCFGDTTGGTAELNWYMQYVTREEAEPKLTSGAYNMYEGWYIGWNGTTTLDEQAAKTVLGITTTDYNDFDTWWDTNSNEVTTDWENWLLDEAGEERLNIYPSYNYALSFVYFVLDAEKSGDEIVVSFDTISWGMEILMTRWMGEAFMPTEWYMEDMNLIATIGPEMADLDVDTAIGYAVYAEISQEDGGAPIWGWEGLMQDFLPSTISHPGSIFDPYDGQEYSVWGPGNEYYGEQYEYAYTPGAWNLSEGETLVFEWPAGDQLFFDHDPGNTDGLVDNTQEVIAPMTVTYAEPVPSDMPSQITIDVDARQIAYTGPFDMWTWAQDQTTHQNLSDEWDRLDLLPWGIPAIQFKADIAAMLAAGVGIQSELDENAVDAGAQDISVMTSGITEAATEDPAAMAIPAVTLRQTNVAD